MDIISGFDGTKVCGMSAANSATLEAVPSKSGAPDDRPNSAVRGLRIAATGLPATVAITLSATASYLLGSSLIPPDVLTYEAIARNLTLHRLVGGIREPIWPLVYYLPVHLLGDQSWIAVRCIGVAGFVFMIIVFQLLCANLFGRWWSILAALVMAASPWMVYQSTRGLREQTAVGLVLLMCLGLVQPSLSRRRYIALFVLAGLTGLLRADVMDVMVGTLVISLLVRRPPLVVWIAGPAIVAAFMAPTLLTNYLGTGDPFYTTNVLARFFRNVEFAGQPGFITREEMKVDSFAGARVTWMHYVFGMHTPGELLTRLAIAWVAVPARLVGLVLFFKWPDRLSGWALSVTDAVELVIVASVYMAALVGGLALLRTRAWVVPVTIGGIIVLYSPIAPFMDFRLVLAVAPLMLICLIHSIRQVPILFGWKRVSADQSRL